MDEGTYISTRVEELRRHTDEFYEIGDNVSNEFNTWSALKLILHSAAVNMYTDVHANQGTGDIFYIDTLAGSGISSYDEAGHFIGSPLVALKAATKPFDYMYFIEGNDDYAEALEARLEHAFTKSQYTEPHDWEVINGDANDELPGVVSDIRDRGDYDARYNYYCFIDNEALDIKWDAIEELTPKPFGDLLINVPTTAFGRASNQNSFDEISSFFGRDMSADASGPVSRNRLKNKYITQVRNRNRKVNRNVHVDADTGSYCYDMLYATRRTGGDNGYVEVIEYVKQFIERVDAGDVDRMLNVMDGDQATIDSLLPEQDISDKLPEEDDQSGLDEFL